LASPLIAAMLVAAVLGGSGACSSDAAPKAVGSAASARPSAAPSETASSAATSGLQAAPLDGAELLARFQCARCHDGTGEAAVAPEKHCAKCHEAIGDGTFKAPADALADWKPHVMHLRFVPSLSGVGRLVKTEWAARYIAAPFDLRPDCHPQMPRLAIAPEEAEAIAAHLAGSAAAAGPAPSGSLTRGRQLFEQKTCSTCHVYSGAGTPPPLAMDPLKTPRDRALAPDLRFARARLVPGNVAAYLLDPKSVKPDAAMPKLQLSAEEASDLATFVLQAPLAEVRPADAPRRLPVLERAVAYDEVASRVLHKICWHCHSQPDYARGDGGPGNTGGFGFTARRLDLSSYESIASGYVDLRGERRSLFSQAPDGEPMLLSVLLARQREAAGVAGEPRGMPLGLPPLPPEDIQLIETWISQGHPR
jgi:mono/diheme cytochrome c family protein